MAANLGIKIPYNSYIFITGGRGTIIKYRDIDILHTKNLCQVFYFQIYLLLCMLSQGMMENQWIL